MKRVVIWMLLLFCCANVQQKSAQADPQLNNQENVSTQRQSLYLSKNFATRKYILGPGDMISISVYDTPEFEQEKVRIQPDGKMVVTPLGSIMVSGLTVDDLEENLKQKYKYYLKDPQITIKLEETRPFIVYISGAVINPGSYELNTSNQIRTQTKEDIQVERKTPLLSNVLIAAGGIKYDADLEHVQIKNNLDNSKYEVNLFELLEKGDSDQDIYLMAGDSVMIPQLPSPLAVDEAKYKKFASATFSPKSVPVRVFGFVNNPGLVRLEPSQSLNLNSAITSAGGYLNDSAYAPKKVYISRVDVSGKLSTKAVNPMSNDITLMPNDIVYVPEKSRPLAGKAFDYLGRVLTPVNSFADSYNNWALMFNPTRYQVIGK